MAYCMIKRRFATAEPAHLTINFTRVTSTSYAYARVPSTSTTNITYQSSKFDQDVDAGLKFRVYVAGNSRYSDRCKITLNGTTVKTGAGYCYFTINSGNVTVSFKPGSYSGIYDCEVTGDCTWSLYES